MICFIIYNFSRCATRYCILETTTCSSSSPSWKIFLRCLLIAGTWTPNNSAMAFCVIQSVSSYIYALTDTSPSSEWYKIISISFEKLFKTNPPPLVERFSHYPLFLIVKSHVRTLHKILALNIKSFNIENHPLLFFINVTTCVGLSRNIHCFFPTSSNSPNVISLYPNGNLNSLILLHLG